MINFKHTSVFVEKILEDPGAVGHNNGVEVRRKLLQRALSMSTMFRNILRVPDSRNNWSKRTSSSAIQEDDELGDRLSSEKFFSRSDQLVPGVFTKKINVSGPTLIRMVELVKNHLPGTNQLLTLSRLNYFLRYHPLIKSHFYSDPNVWSLSWQDVLR
jgi:hypothetical protein